MGQARRGRPRKAGARDAKGRLITFPDRGNAVVQARSARFARFHDGKADPHLGDQIGRAWAAGLLDGTACDAAILRDVGRRYGGLYWNEFAAMAPKMGALERRDRSFANDNSDDRPGQLFAALDALARSTGREAVAAMHALCVDTWWFPDADQPWVARLINSAVMDAGGKANDVGACHSDRGKIAAAVKALAAMVEGHAPRPSGRAYDRG